jgi:hypothetical protein
MVLQAFLLSLFLIALLGYDRNEFGKALYIYFAGITWMFFSTGYLLTTGVSRAIWKGRKIWSYPVIAAILYSIHFEILNLEAGGAFEPPDRIRIRVAGACIAFACAHSGSYGLQWWTRAGSKRALHHGQSANRP